VNSDESGHGSDRIMDRTSQPNITTITPIRDQLAIVRFRCQAPSV
jgi:hypothetical protein